MIRIFIAPMASGKSSWVTVSPHTRFDSDDARLPEVEDTLKALRRKNDWTAHNLIWHELLMMWASKLPRNCAVTCHSMADAVAITQGSGAAVRFFIILVPPDEWQSRQAQRKLNAEEKKLAKLNRRTVEDDAARNPTITVLNDFPMLSRVEES